MSELYQTLPGGITRIDTGYIRPGFAASYLMEVDGKAVFIDTGPQLALPRLLGALQHRGLHPEAVESVMVTHVHLDHAGGAGALLAHLPNAHLLVHPKGARHLIDPGKLQAGAMAVYGEETFRKTLGGITPVAAERTVTPEDGEAFILNQRRLVFLHTPGHAHHHMCIWDPETGGIFSGDAFGISYREFDSQAGIFLFPATTPVQFDPEMSRRSIERLVAMDPQWLFLTHFGRVRFRPHLAEVLQHQLRRYVELAQETLFKGQQRCKQLEKKLETESLDRLATLGAPLTREEHRNLLAMDHHINAQGLQVWMDRRVNTPPR